MSLTIAGHWSTRINKSKSVKEMLERMTKLASDLFVIGSTGDRLRLNSITYQSCPRLLQTCCLKHQQESTTLISRTRVQSNEELLVRSGNGELCE